MHSVKNTQSIVHNGFLECKYCRTFWQVNVYTRHDALFLPLHLVLFLRNHSLQFNLATLIRLISHQLSILVEHEKKLKYKKKKVNEIQ